MSFTKVSKPVASFTKIERIYATPTKIVKISATYTNEAKISNVKEGTFDFGMFDHALFDDTATSGFDNEVKATVIYTKIVKP